VEVKGKMRNPMYAAFKYTDEEDSLDKFSK
jgi:hypothetical protein